MKGSCVLLSTPLSCESLVTAFYFCQRARKPSPMTIMGFKMYFGNLFSVERLGTAECFRLWAWEFCCVRMDLSVVFSSRLSYVFFVAAEIFC